MLLLIALTLGALGLIALIELVPLYQNKKWWEMAAVLLLISLGGSLAIAMILGLEIDMPLRNIVNLLPSFLDPVIRVLLLN